MNETQVLPSSSFRATDNEVSAKIKGYQDDDKKVFTNLNSSSGFFTFGTLLISIFFFTLPQLELAPCRIAPSPVWAAEPEKKNVLNDLETNSVIVEFY